MTDTEKKDLERGKRDSHTAGLAGGDGEGHLGPFPAKTT
jgi:hypothetical protein